MAAVIDMVLLSLRGAGEEDGGGERMPHLGCIVVSLTHRNVIGNLPQTRVERVVRPTCQSPRKGHIINDLSLS